jgi:predicted transcriptional regulator
MPKKLLEIAADIIQTQASSNQLSSEEIVSSLRQIFGVLQEMEKSEAQGNFSDTGKESVAAVPDKKDPKDSIQADTITCLECGMGMRQLTAKHLKGHGLTLREYRQKYGFPLKQALSARSLTKLRSKLAKKRGLPENLRKYLQEKREQKAEGAVAVATAPVLPEEVKKPANPAKRTRIRKKA